MPAQIDPETGERVQIDPSTGERMGASPQPLGTGFAPINPALLPPNVGQNAFKAGVNARILGVSPGFAYQNGEEIDKQMKAKAGDDYDSSQLDPTILNDIKVGWESSIFGLHHYEAMPEKVRNPGLMDRAVSGLTEMVADLPFYIGGAMAGGAAGSEVPVVGNVAGAAAGGFALPAALREVLIQGIQKGDVKDFSDLMHRAASVTWAATKGAVVGAATEAAGGLPVGSFLAKSGLATTAVKGLYQATALTTAADLLEGHIPNAQDFAGNAALIIPLNLITHGLPLRTGEAKQALMDVYAKDGKHPADSKITLDAQPPVKPDMPPGLNPAIDLGVGHIEGDTDESHADLSERVLGKKPVSMEQLEADPAKADTVLENPAIHEQDVIDRAWQLKSEAVDAGDVPAGEDGEKPTSINDLYDRSAMKSGRGFTTPDGQFLSRMEARKWMKDNEPDVHEMWLNGQDGDKQAELHSEDYAAARQRVQARNLAEGDAVTDAMPPDIKRSLAEARSQTGILNKIRAGLASARYGYEAIRTLLIGPRNYLRAEGGQIVSRLRSLVPDKVDQQALHFLRDYRDDPEQLRADIEEVRAGDNEKLKDFLPAMERALQPMSPEMAQADAEMTDYFSRALDLGRQVGTLNSAVDPSRYSPRMFMKATEGSGGGASRPNFTTKTVNAIRRDYLHTLDPLKEGDVEARTFNAFDEMSVYNDRHATSIATSIFKNELRNSALGVEGTRDNHPDGWVMLDPSFRSTRAFTDMETGQAHLVSSDFYVPKDVADALEPLFRGEGGLSQLTKFLHIQSVVKGIELTLSAFHIKALTITAFNNEGIREFVGSIFSDNNSPTNEGVEKRGALYGLTTTKTGTPFEAYSSMKPNEVPTGLARLKDNFVTQAASAVAEKITKAIFDIVQRKFKVMDFAKKEAAWIAKHPNATESEYGAAMRGYAKEINASYGGLNWEVMGVSKGMQNVFRLVLLAPDWTFSNVANLKYALTDGGTAGAASRSFFIKSFATGIAMTAAASIYIGGKYDPSDVTHMDQVYLGTDKDGKEMYANWFFAGAPKDAINLYKRSYRDGPIAGLTEMVLSKAAPTAGTIVDVAKNKDYKGAPIYKPSDSDLAKSGKDLLYAGEKLVPITGVSAYDAVHQALTDPDHEYSYRDLLELAADAMGSQTMHVGSDEGSTTSKSVIPGQKKGSQGMKLPGQKKFSIRSGR